MKVSFSPAAQADLLDIAAFIAQDNPARALTFVDELESKCDALGGAPGIGTLRPELGEGICMLPHGRYLIFYRAVNQDLRTRGTVPNEVVNLSFERGVTPMAAWREHFGLTQTQVAARMGITQAAYAQMERVKQPRKVTLEKVSAAMGLELEQLRW